MRTMKAAADPSYKSCGAVKFLQVCKKQSNRFYERCGQLGTLILMILRHGLPSGPMLECVSSTVS